MQAKSSSKKMHTETKGQIEMESRRKQKGRKTQADRQTKKTTGTIDTEK